jgi:hypothetical protein
MSRQSDIRNSKPQIDFLELPQKDSFIMFDCLTEIFLSAFKKILKI